MGPGSLCGRPSSRGWKARARPRTDAKWLLPELLQRSGCSCRPPKRLTGVLLPGAHKLTGNRCFFAWNEARAAALFGVESRNQRLSVTDTITQVDLTNCDREPIHTPGAIQPFGFLIAVTTDWIVARVSENIS